MKKNLIAGLLFILCCMVAFAYAAQNCGTSLTDEVSQPQPLQRKAVKRDYGKVLVAYFSVPETDGVDASSGASRVVINGKLIGNTHYVASVIAKATGGDLFEIKTTHAYPGSHKALIDAAKKEADNNARPKLATHIKNIKDYDVVFVGFPNWWYDMPMPIYSFFDEYDFTDKTIIPFCTHGGSRFSDAIKTIRKMEKRAIVLDGHSIARERVENSESETLQWLKRIGIRLNSKQ